MNNQELELKIKEIIGISNYFNMIIAAKDFEKEYKQSDFYKLTKQPLIEVLKNAKEFYFFQMDDFFKRIQKQIDGLNFEQIMNILNEFADLFDKENKDFLNTAELLKTIMK